MKLKAILDTLDGLDESLKQFYTEKDGKFVLLVEGYDPGETEKLRTTMRRVKDEKAEAIRELNDLKERFAGVPDDMSAADISALLDKTGGTIDQQLTAQRDRLTKDKEVAIKKVTEERDTFKSRIEKLARENAVNTAMTEGNIAPHMREVVGDMLMMKAKVNFEGEETIVTIEDLPALDFVKSWGSSEKGKHFVAAPGNSGGGSGGNQGGSGGKDYSKMTHTELAIAQDKDPAAKAEIDRRTKIEKPPVR